MTDRIDLAAPLIESLLEDEPERPEVVRAYAALTIKRDGIDEAHKALERLEEAQIRTRADRCQFHLLYGLFCLGIDDKRNAIEQFRRAHAADRSNVFVMMKWARTLFDIGRSRWLESDQSYRPYLDDCANLVRQILEFDIDNSEGLALAHSLSDFSIEV